MLWFKSFLGLNFIFLCFKVMIMYDSSEFKTMLNMQNLGGK